MKFNELKSNKDADYLLSYLLNFNKNYPERFIHPYMVKEFEEHRDKITEGLTQIKNYLNGNRVNQMIELREKKLSFAEIGERFGISRQRVHQIFKKLD